MKYSCHECGGTGRVICSGPEWDDYETTCPYCGGTGKQLTEKPLEEFENLEKALEMACAELAKSKEYFIMRAREEYDQV